MYAVTPIHGIFYDLHTFHMSRGYPERTYAKKRINFMVSETKSINLVLLNVCLTKRKAANYGHMPKIKSQHLIYQINLRLQVRVKQTSSRNERMRKKEKKVASLILIYTNHHPFCWIHQIVVLGRMRTHFEFSLPVYSYYLIYSVRKKSHY